MNPKSIITVFAAIVPILFACSQGIDPVSADETVVAGAMETGDAEVTVSLGRIGTLGKSAAIRMNRLLLTLSATGEPQKKDTIGLSSTGEFSMTKLYRDLPVGKVWRVTAQSVDAAGKTIHAGAVSFQPVSCGIVPVELDLDAQYSMLKACFFPIPDSVTMVTVYLDRKAVATAGFASGARTGDTITLSFDYMSACSSGTSHTLRLEASGVVWGERYILYAVDTAMSVVSGEDETCNLRLGWKGPTVYPFGSAEMQVSLGAVGTVTLNGVFDGAPTDFYRECVSKPLAPVTLPDPCPGDCNIRFPDYCTCDCSDPAHEHDYSHVLDVGVVVESVYVSFEVAPDAVDSTCLTDAFIYVSADGKAWTKCWYKEDMPYGEKIKQQVKVQNKFRYIRTSTDGCAADWLNVAVVK